MRRRFRTPRPHLAQPSAKPATHIREVEAVLEYEDLPDVVLVGHSDGGMVLTGLVGGRILAGVYARVAARPLALATAIWHNWRIGAPIKRSLIAYDHPQGRRSHRAFSRSLRRGSGE